jgi:hypothetical protein
MSLSVGRCLWHGVGQAEYGDRGPDDQRAGAANLLWSDQSADQHCPSPGAARRGWDEYGGVSAVVSIPLPGQMQSFLAQENVGLAAADWKITCMRFAPNAPEQNPVEDLWLKGKTYLRQQFAVNKTFAAVKHCFSTFLRTLSFKSSKCRWYWPDPQMI